MGELSLFARAVMFSLVIWAIGAIVLLMNFVHITPNDKGRISSITTMVDSMSPPSMRATPLVEIPKPANYCDSHGPHTQIWGSPQFRVQQSKLPLIAIAVATTSRHMEDRNGPDADKVSTSELQRRGQQSRVDDIFSSESLPSPSHHFSLLKSRMAGLPHHHSTSIFLPAHGALFGLQVVSSNN